MRYEIYSSVNEIFAKRREEAELSADSRRAILHEQFPEIKKIDAELAGTGLRIMEAAFAGADVTAIVEQLKTRSIELQQKRKSILLAHGISTDYSDIKRYCNKCSDSGYIGLTMCDCFKRELNRERYMNSGLGKAFEGKTFETMNSNYATGKSENGITPRDNLENVISFCRQYAKDVCEKQCNLMLIGGTGLGKTHLSSAIAIAALENGCDVYYDTMISILDKQQKNDDRYQNRIYESQLLICDDFGTEFLNDYRMSIVYNIINHRIINGKSTLINTNLNLEELGKRYDSRICSRIFGEFYIKHLFGQDVRRLKLLEQKNS